MTYAEKLRDPRWQKKRLIVFKRDKWTCTLCKDTETTLHVHHYNYHHSGNPWDSDIDSLVTYCADCHALTEYINDDTVFIAHVHKINFDDGSKMLVVRYVKEGEVFIEIYNYKNGRVSLRLQLTEETCVEIFDFLYPKRYRNGK